MAYAINEKIDHSLQRADYNWGSPTAATLWADRDCRLKVEWVNIRDPRQVRTIDLGRREPFRKIIMIRFSPDSARLAVLEEDRITTIEVATGKSEVAMLDDNNATAVTWFNDSQQVYVTGKGLWRRSAAGTDPGVLHLPLPLTTSQVADTKVCRWWSVSLSPRGRYLIVYAQPPNRFGPVWVLDVQQPRTMELRLAPSSNKDRDCSWNSDETAAIISPVLPYKPSQVDPNAVHVPGKLMELHRQTALVDLERWQHRDVTEQLEGIAGDWTYYCPSWIPGERNLVITMYRGNETKRVIVSPTTWEFPLNSTAGSGDLFNGNEIYRKTCRLQMGPDAYAGGGASSPYTPHLALHTFDERTQQVCLTLYQTSSPASTQPTTHPATQPTKQ